MKWTTEEVNRLKYLMQCYSGNNRKASLSFAKESNRTYELIFKKSKRLHRQFIKWTDKDKQDLIDSIVQYNSIPDGIAQFAIKTGRSNRSVKSKLSTLQYNDPTYSKLIESYRLTKRLKGELDPILKNKLKGLSKKDIIELVLTEQPHFKRRLINKL